MKAEVHSTANVVFVEYCRSCDTHSWCTHHDEAKYHETFLKLSEMLAERHPQLQVIGNMVPDNLIPFKIAENKYIDVNTNKYVVYPQIGSFEVLFNDTLVFSKKEVNTWPILTAVVDRISSILDPNFQSPPKEPTSKSPPKQKQSPPKFKHTDGLRSSDEKNIAYKDQTKGFTLTDHFKLYRPKSKNNDKDWLTEKYESEGSSRQLSEFGRTESREKSEASDSSKVVLKDLTGETKLKEMLRNRGLLVKDQGRKEMIVKLDSIQEENACYDENGATQRTTEKNNKKKKIQQLEDAFSSLQNKFINFQTKVKDIKTQNDDFDNRKNQGDNLTKSRSKIPYRREDSAKHQDKQVPIFQKTNNSGEKASRLQQYLNATEEEKNEKLHRIYGQLRLLKQTAKKNKRILQLKQKNSNNQNSSDNETSLSNSHASGSIIAFQPRQKNSIEKQISSVLNNKTHKFSSKNPNIQLSHMTSDPKFRTEDHFYQQRPHGQLRKQKVDIEHSEAGDYSSAGRLIKNIPGGMSLQVFRSKENNTRFSKTRPAEVSYLSNNAKQNIKKIHARMSKLQQQLSQHKKPEDTNPAHHTSYGTLKGQQPNKQRSQSGDSSEVSTKQFVHSKNITKMDSFMGNNQTGLQNRDSYRTVTNSKKASLSKKNRLSNFSEVTHKNTSKSKKPAESMTIQEESEPRDSKIHTQRSNQQSLNPTTAKTKKNKESIQTYYRHPKPINKSPEQRYIKQQSQYLKPEAKRDSEEESEEDNAGRESRSRSYQKSSRLRKYELHEPVTYLRKQKDWKESDLSPSQRQKRNLSREIEHQEQEELHVDQKGNSRQTLAKQGHSARKAPNNDSKEIKTPKKGVKLQKNQESVAQISKAANEKTTFGRIKKNKKKEALSRHNESKNSQNTKYQMKRANQQWNQRQSMQEDQQQSERIQTSSQEERSFSREHSGKIATHRGNKKVLKYSKTEDYCYNGTMPKQTSQPINSDAPYSAGSSSIEGNSDKALSNERVEGWKMSSDQDENDDMNNQSDYEEQSVDNEDEEEATEQPMDRRNSLDQELEQMKETDQVAINDSPKRTDSFKQNRKDAESRVQLAEFPLTSGQVTEKDVNEQREEVVSKDNISEKVNKEEPKLQNQQNKKEQRQQIKQDMKGSDKKAAPAVIKTNIEETLSKQYVNFLLVKIASELSKTEPQANQNKKYEDAEFCVNVNYCASIESICSVDFPQNFVDYEPPVTSMHDTANINQANEEELVEQPNQKAEEEGDNQQELYSQNSFQKNQQKQNKEIDEPKTAIVPIINVTESITGETKNATLSQKSAKTHSNKDASQHSAVEDDNVYTESKEPSKYKEIGVQKQTTVEISVQTDGQPALDTILKPRTNTLNSHHSQLSNSTSKKGETTNKNKPVGLQNKDVSGPSRFQAEKQNQKPIERAQIIKKIYSSNVHVEASKFEEIINGSGVVPSKEQGFNKKMQEVYPLGELMQEKTLETQLIQTEFKSLLKTVEILCEKSEWLISRLLEDKCGVLKDCGFGVWLCRQYQWECFIVDDTVPLNQLKEPYSRHNGGQLWFNVLEKALSCALGGYEQLRKADSSIIFTMLTGCNAITVKVKEDPTKNSKILNLISDCLRKNYIIHAAKNWDKTRSDGRDPVYYIHSVRRGGGEDEALIEMSQDGRESFWVKHSKFVQQFGKIDILQLRVSHNFGHIDLGLARAGQMTVVQLDFEEEGQGCVTLAYLNHSGPLRVFLYKEEKSKVLKLVGQAKEKNKTHLFFECNFSEGKYFAFVQANEHPARLSFSGQSQPRLKITEQIHSQGLKNDIAEYLPVNEDRLRRTDQQSDIRGSKFRFRDNLLQSRLRDNFVEYVLGRSKRN